MKNTILSTLIKSALRHVLTLCGGILIAKGLVTPDTAASAIASLTDVITGLLVSGAGVGIAALTHSDAHTVAKLATGAQEILNQPFVDKSVDDVFKRD